MQTGRIDYNIDEKNITWFRFQADTGLQAAYTDPINPLFNAVSPQPLYSFAAGYTHVFSPHLVNYFNPAFSWYESLFGPAIAARRWRLSRSCSRASAPTLRLRRWADWTTPGCRDGAPAGSSSTIIWRGRHGAHELRFGTNTRIFRLNDYDFGEGDSSDGDVHDLPEFIYGVASTASKTFPVADSQPFDFLNLDFYAQDTWKLTSKLTWTFGLRDTYNSNPLNPHDTVARLAGSFDAISHDVNQPLIEPIQTRLSNLFASTPLAILQPRTALRGRSRRKLCCGPDLDCSAICCPGSVADLIGANPPYVKTFQGGLLGTVGGTAIAPGVPTAPSMPRLPRIRASIRLCRRAAFLRLSAGQSDACLPPVSITAVPDGKLHAPYFMQWSFAVEHQIGNTVSLRAQYVGTRAVNQPYTTQVNGYQTVCAGCFAPFPYGQPADPRFGAVTQLSTGANSHYNGLQLTAEKRMGHGLQVQVNYTWSRCMDTVSNGGFLPFSAAGFFRRLPGDLRATVRPCDYDVRHNLTANYVYQLPSSCAAALWARC